MIRFIFFTIIFFILFFIIRVFYKLFMQGPKSSVNSFKRKKEETKFNNMQDAEFTEIESEDQKKNK